MSGYIQRHPFSPKAVWWKNYYNESNFNHKTYELMKVENNNYVRQFSFDCVIDSQQQKSISEPLQGLLTDSNLLKIKTQNFLGKKDEPKAGDIIQYRGRFWVIEECYKTFIYLPKEKTIITLSLKVLNRNLQ